MTYTTRRIIFYTFAVLFLIAAPALILFTEGFRFNLQTGRLERLGVLVIKSKPEEATITLSNKISEEKTPASIKLPADDYPITVSKEGYSSWTKLLPVRSRYTTFIEDVLLFKNTEPKQIINDSIIGSAFSSDLRYILTANKNNEIAIYDIACNSNTVLEKIENAKEITKLSFSPDNSSATINYTTTLGLKILHSWALGSGEPTLSSANISNLGFDELVLAKTSGTFSGVKNNFLYTLNIFTNRLDKITKSKSPFYFRGTNVWSIDNETSLPFVLYSQPGNLNNEPQAILSLPQDKYSFGEIESPYLLLQAKNSKRIFLIDPQEPTTPVLDIQGTRSAFRHNRDGELELLSWDDFEIWRGNAARNTTELLWRQSNPLLGVAWHPLGEYIFFATKNEIYALELDNRDTKNITTLFSQENVSITDFAIDPTGKKIYFSVAGESGAGVYEREL